MGKPLGYNSADEVMAICRNARSDDYTRTVDNLESALKEKFQAHDDTRLEVKTMHSELVARERAITQMQKQLEKQREVGAKLQDDCSKAQNSTAHLDGQNKKLKDEVRRLTISTKAEERTHAVIQEKHSNLRDLASYEDRAFKSEQEVKRLTAILVAKEGDLRCANQAIKTLDMDMHQCQDKAEDLIKKESQNHFSELNRRIADLAEENRVLARQVKVLNAAGQDAAFTRHEAEEPVHHELYVLQAEVKRLKQKLDTTEASLRCETDSSHKANKMLMQMNEMLRHGTFRSSRHRNLLHESPKAGDTDSPSLSRQGSTGLPVTPQSAGQRFVDSLSFAMDNSSTPLPSMTDGDINFTTDTVPLGLFEMLQKENLAMKQEVKQHDLLLKDKDCAIEVILRKQDTHERFLDVEKKRHKREVHDLTKELKQFKGDAKKGMRWN